MADLNCINCSAWSCVEGINHRKKISGAITLNLDNSYLE